MDVHGHRFVVRNFGKFWPKMQFVFHTDTGHISIRMKLHMIFYEGFRSNSMNILIFKKTKRIIKHENSRMASMTIDHRFVSL
jgi:uncharacterized protein YfaT (DUF1175 family)